MLESVVAPDSWRTNGGSAAQARYFAGHLVVVQTWEGHRQVQELLRGVRQAAPGSGRPASPELLLWNEGQRQWLHAGPDPAERALRTVLPEVRLEAATLPAAADQLGRLARANVLLDHAALDDGGFDMGLTLDLRLYDVTLHRALETVVEGFARAGWPLDFTVRDGAIVISSTGKIERHPVTRVYDLRDWPHAGAWAQRPKPADPGAAPLSRAEAVEELSRAIMESVAPDSWRDNGGVPGSILFAADRLIVTQTWRNQEKVRRFLDVMRAAPPAPAAKVPATAPASRPAD